MTLSIVPAEAPPNALVARVPKGVGFDGPSIPGPDGRRHQDVSEPVFSADGRRVAYVGYRGSQSHPVTGDMVGEPYQFLSPPAVGAGRFAFRAGNRVGNGDRERWWVLVDDERVGEADWIGTPAVSKDGNTMAWWTQPGARIAPDGTYTQGRHQLVVARHDGTRWALRPGAGYDDAEALTAPVIAAEGSRVATVARKGGRAYVLIVDGKRETLGKEAYARITGLCYGPKGRYVAFAAATGSAGSSQPPGMGFPGGSSHIVFKDKPHGEAFDDAGCPVMAPNGKHVAYKIVQGGRMGIAVGSGKRAEAEHGFVSTPVFSPDSKRVAYVAYTGAVEPMFALMPEMDRRPPKGSARVIVRSVRRGKPTRHEAHPSVRDPVFGPKGKALAYRAMTDAGWKIVAGAQESATYDLVTAPRFVEEGTGVAFGALAGRELRWCVLTLE